MLCLCGISLHDYNTSKMLPVLWIFNVIGYASVLISENIYSNSALLLHIWSRAHNENSVYASWMPNLILHVLHSLSDTSGQGSCHGVIQVLF